MIGKKKLNLLSRVGEIDFNKGIDSSLPIPCLKFFQCRRRTFVLNFFNRLEFSARLVLHKTLKLGMTLTFTAR